MTFILNEIIDMHIHTKPDVQPRLLNDIQAAQQAKEAGMRAILIKSHVVVTSDRAAIAENIVGGIRVFGGLALNYAVGGFNPEAVDAAIQMGAKEIWMPTRDAMNMYHHARKDGGLSIFQEDGSINPAIPIILEQINQADIILASGHLSVKESVTLIQIAKNMGLRKIVITHPEAEFIAMPVPIQQELSRSGVYFERCFVDTTPMMHYATSVEEIGQHICEVGIHSTILSTDLGQAGNPSPVEGMAFYLESLLKYGYSENDIYKMASQNPANLLEL